MHQIKLDDYLVNYQVFFKNNKHIYLRVRHGKLIITCPKNYKSNQIKDFIVHHKDWIIRRLEEKKLDLYHPKQMKIWGKTYGVVIDESLDEHMKVLGHQILIKTYDRQLIESFYQSEVMEKVRFLLSEHASQLNDIYPVKKLKFKTQLMSSRLGSCHVKKKTIKMNSILARLDPKFFTLVFFHEYAHLRFPHHQDDFHHLLEKLVPNHKTQSRLLTKEVRGFVY